MPIQFVGPALQGASMIGRFGVPLLQQAGISAGFAGLGAAAAALNNRPAASSQGTRRGAARKAGGSSISLNIFSDPVGREKLLNAWPNDLSGLQSPGFGYMGGQLPTYTDAQGYLYDAVSGKRMWRQRSAGSSPSTQPTSSQALGASPPGAGSPGQQTAAERAYQSEKASIAQQAAQNPELQRYEQQRAAAAASGDQAQMNAVRDQGMAIWQKKYGVTPMAQPGGAVGTRNPLMDKTFGYQSGSAPDQQMGAPTLGPSPLVPQIDPTLNPTGPNYLGGEGPPLMNFADPRFENMSPEDFQKLLNQVNKK